MRSARLAVQVAVLRNVFVVLVALPALWPLAGLRADDRPALPDFAELERVGATIGTIRIEIGDIFDPSIPGEGSWLYRTANTLHIETRESVVRKQLLIESGQRVDARLIAENERLLRANEYFYDASIEVEAFHDGVADLIVRSRDVWTLNPGLNFSRKGGENKFGVEIEEKNLLGSGRHISLGWRTDVDREQVIASYFDPHFLDSWNRFGIVYSDADDGSTKVLRLERPFYALDTRRAASLFYSDAEREESRYVEGDKVGSFEHFVQHDELMGGWSAGLRGSWVRRWTFGITYDRDRFEVVPGEPLAGPLPEDRELLYPWIGFELVEDAYQERLNQDQIRRTEDVLVGWRASARVGLAGDALGSDRDALILKAALQNGLQLGPDAAVFGSLAASGRIEDEGLRNGVLAAEARYYRTTGRKTKFYAAVSGVLAEDLDAENQLLLGGDTGLRGYPLRYQAGTARALLTLEQRYYTGWYPFRLVHVAGAAFFDMGRTWGTDVTGADSLGLLKDLGVGLRLGSSRSSFGNVIHIDLAFPLDGDDSIDSVQLIVETKGRF